jgi:hypothetical protein
LLTGGPCQRQAKQANYPGENDLITSIIIITAIIIIISPCATRHIRESCFCSYAGTVAVDVHVTLECKQPAATTTYFQCPEPRFRHLSSPVAVDETNHPAS